MHGRLLRSPSPCSRSPVTSWTGAGGVGLRVAATPLRDSAARPLIECAGYRLGGVVPERNDAVVLIDVNYPWRVVDDLSFVQRAERHDDDEIVRPDQMRCRAVD